MVKLSKTMHSFIALQLPANCKTLVFRSEDGNGLLSVVVKTAIIPVTIALVKT